MQRNVSSIRLRRRAAFCALFLGLAFARLAFSDPPPSTDLIRQGIAAIEASDFQTADDDFREAVKISGPGAYHEIGITEAAVAGRELRAVCWLAAYLAADPHAADAAQTREAITQLMARQREKTLLLIQRFADQQPPPPDGASATPSPLARMWDHGPTRTQGAHEGVLQGFAYSWDTIGDFDAARRVMGMMGKIGWNGPKSGACTALIRAECSEATRRYGAGDVSGALALLATAQKEALLTFEGIAPDRDRAYCVAMAQLQITRALIAAGKWDDAWTGIASIRDDDDDRQNADTQASIATTEIVMARAQVKSGDTDSARKTLAEAAKIAFVIKRYGSPLRYVTLCDLADAETEAGDLEDARAALNAAAPLVTIYNDPDHARLDVVRAQLKAGDQDGAQKTAALMTDTALKAKAQQAIATPPAPPNPGEPPRLVPPLPSQYLALPAGETPHAKVDPAQWMRLLELNLDAPCFTAFSDDADAVAIALSIQREPVRVSRQPPPPDLPASLELVGRRMIAARIAVERQLHLQFGP